MPILTLNQQIEELKAKVSVLMQETDSNDAKIKDLQASLSEIDEIVQEDAQIHADSYEVKNPDIKLPSISPKEVNLVDILNKMYKIIE